MRALACVLVALAIVPGFAPTAQADPLTVACLVNSFLLSPPDPLQARRCIPDPSDMPACSQYFDRASAVLWTSPCATACTDPPPGWLVNAAASGDSGDVFDAELRCDGSVALTAPVAVLFTGVGIGHASGPAPAGSVVSCGASNVPLTVTRYFVACVPAP